MRFYELTYLLRPGVEKVQAFCEKINSFVQEEGGILGKTRRPQKKKLGYEIGKKEFQTAFLCSSNFYLDSKKLKNLEKKLKKEREILRFSFFKKKPKKKAREFPKRRPKKRKKPKKVELKKIEQKIEEILGE